MEPGDSASVHVDCLRFINRDHVIVASVHEGDVTLTTTLGSTVVISGPPEKLEEFLDGLLNAYGSNFVAVPASPGSEEMIG